MASESLCYHCNRIFTLEYDPDLTDLTYERDDSYPDLPNFATTSLGGCSACGLLRSGLQWKLEQLKLHTKSNYAEWDKTISVKKIIVVLENEVLNDKLAEDKNGPCRFHLQFVIPILGNRLERVAFDIYADEGTFASAEQRWQRQA
jgi:hypothetical protein